MNADTMHTSSSEGGEQDGPVDVGHAGLAAAIQGMLLLKVRSFLSPANQLKIAGGAVAMGIVVYLWLGGRGEQRLGDWLATTFLGYMLPLICLTMGGGALRNEMKEFTIEYLWTRPVKRSHLLLGSYVACVVSTTLLCVIFGLAIYGAGLCRGVDLDALEFMALMVAVLGGCLSYVAISLCLGVVSGKYMVLGIVYGMVVEVGISQIPMNVRNLAVSHHLRAIYPGSLSGDGSAVVAWALGLLACSLIAAAALFVGSLVFSNKRVQPRFR